MATNLPIRSARVSDVALALFVVSITGLLLIPLPAVVLDFLLAVNISFSLVLLLVALYMRNALALLAFPSILLLSTLFRLGLNVASTRLILADGYAGKVIEAFGNFLIRGDVVVGLIIFAIITVVNFIVVSRGSIRVSEVAARFALDAMPGKQMAIESDLRAGLISTQEAGRRREELKRESQLYGAMDGAMKFVQGDVIAGIFIIFVNILGGMYLGISNGLNFADALQTYTILTVGDGLVSQIPALLVSICAGIVVTRVASGDNTTLGSDVGEQLLGRPAALVFAGLLLAFFGLIPGLPTTAFLTVGGLCAGFGIFRARQNARSEALAMGPSGSTQMLPALSGPDSRGSKFESVTSDQTIVLHLDSVMARLYRESEMEIKGWWSRFRSDYRNDLGLLLPEIALADAELDTPGEYLVEYKENKLFSGRVVPDGVFLPIRPVEAEILGLEVLQEEAHPRTGFSGFWAAKTSSTKRLASAMQLEALGSFEHIGLKIGVFFERFPEELLGIAEVHARLKELEQSSPGLVGEALGSAFINASRLTEIMQELVRERIGIRDFRKVVELTSLYCSSFGLALDKDDAFDLDDVVSFIRTKRSRTTLARLVNDRQALRVVTLAPETEEWFVGLKIESHLAGLGAEAAELETQAASLRGLTDGIRSRGIGPLIVLCRAEVRPKVSRFLRVCREAAEVLSFDELDPTLRLETIGIWGE